MSFAPKKSLSSSKMQTKMSAWTPLNHQQSNDHVFKERRELLGKWFDKWTDPQRKQVLQDVFSRCSATQLKFLRTHLCSRVPEETLDFTTVLPRVLALYIFSFLDPRSLCRCAQVSWHWRSIVELDQLWIPKCLRLGWCINFAPTPFEQGVWKRHYIEQVLELNVTKPKTPSQLELVTTDRKVVEIKEEELHRQVLSSHHGQRDKGTSGRSSQIELPPWRGSDKHPTDTLRFNYLENYDPIEQARLAQARGKRTNTTTRQENNRRKPLSDSAYKLRKAKSLMFLSLDLGSGQERNSRPDWATNRSAEYPVTKATAKKLAQTSQWNAGIRPGPARLAVPRMSEKGLRASMRSQRSTPTVPLFGGEPWKIPGSDQGSDED